MVPVETTTEDRQMFSLFFAVANAEGSMLIDVIHACGLVALDHKAWSYMYCQTTLCSLTGWSVSSRRSKYFCCDLSG